MTDKQRIEEWTRFVNHASPSYRLNALLSVLDDGEDMAQGVLKALKLNDGLALLKWGNWK